MNEQNNKVFLSAWVDRDLAHRVRMLAGVMDTSKSEVVRKAVVAYLEDHEIEQDTKTASN